MYNEPRLSTAVWYAVLAVIAVTAAGYVPDNSPAISGGVAVLAFIFFAAAFFYGLNWLIYQINARFDEYKKSMTRTIRIEEMRAAARLSDEQAKLIPMAEYVAEMVIDAGETTRHYLRCPGGLVPIEFVYDFLNDCGVWRLKPIREFPDKTPGREFARMFTEWCIMRQLAIPAVGNEPAHWTSEHAKRRAAQMCELELEVET